MPGLDVTGALSSIVVLLAVGLRVQYFSGAEFDWLDLSNVFWPKVAAQFQMQGMSYKYLRAAPNEPESHGALLKLADRSAYSADVYNHLEEFFLRQGYRDDADRASLVASVTLTRCPRLVVSMTTI